MAVDFDKLKRVLDEVRRLEAAGEDPREVVPEQREDESEEEWLRRCASHVPRKSDDETWVEYVRRVRWAERDRSLDRTVPDRVCPLCKELKLKSKQWVLVGRGALVKLEAARVRGDLRPEVHAAASRARAVCRACYNRIFVRRHSP